MDSRWEIVVPAISAPVISAEILESFPSTPGQWPAGLSIGVFFLKSPTSPKFWTQCVHKSVGPWMSETSSIGSMRFRKNRATHVKLLLGKVRMSDTSCHRQETFISFCSLSKKTSNVIHVHLSTSPVQKPWFGAEYWCIHIHFCRKFLCIRLFILQQNTAMTETIATINQLFAAFMLTLQVKTQGTWSSVLPLHCVFLGRCPCAESSLPVLDRPPA